MLQSLTYGLKAMIRTGSVLNKLNVLRDATSRNFKGGLNVADTELNLSSKFARELVNLGVGIDGSLQVRQGNRLFADIKELTDGFIVDQQYFAGNIISVDDFGQLFSTNGKGDSTRIWDSTIAATLRQGLQIWGATDFVRFEEFGGELIIGNGEDKPLRVDIGLNVDYLADIATGTNVNVPVSSIFAKHDRHLIWATLSSSGKRSIITVSERDAAGTYFGDSGAVYVGSFDLASYVTSGLSDIIAMVSFKSWLMVFFQECIVPVQFSEIDQDNNHDPVTVAGLKINVDPESVIPNCGTIAPRSVQNIGGQNPEVLALDAVGIQSTSLTKITKILSPDRPSRLVDPMLQKLTNQSSDNHDHTFAIYDRRLSSYKIYLPINHWRFQRASRGFAYRYIDSMDLAAWSTIEGHNWRCGCRSAEGRLFFVPEQSTAIFIQGDEVIDEVNADFMGDQETFSDGTIFSDRTGLTPITALDDSGIPIQFDWELPWTDLKQRGKNKTLRYVTLDTEGEGDFTFEVYINNMYKKNGPGDSFSDNTLFDDDLGFVENEPNRTPALSIPFTGGGALSFGLQEFGSTKFGGGNNTSIPALTFAPVQGHLFKFRITGETTKPLKFVAITIYFQLGTVRGMLA